MIAKKYRLREHEITRVFRKGKPFFGEFWTLNYLEDKRNRYSRIAVTISRKHDKRAVARNRYRRGLYDALLPDIQLTGKFLCVFILKKGLKILEKKVPKAWIDDAKKLFTKIKSKGDS